VRIFCSIIIFAFCNLSLVSADVDLDINGGISVAYDDNLTYQNDQELEDMITRLHIGTGINVAGPRLTLNGALNVYHDLYQEHNEFDNTSFDINFDGRMDLSERDHVTIGNIFRHSDRPVSFEESFGRVSGRYTHDRNLFDLGYRRALTSQLSALTHYEQQLNSYSRQDLRDSIQHKVGGGLEYAIDSSNIVGMGYDFTKRDFNRGTSVTANSVFGTYRRYLTKQLYLHLKAGGDFVDSGSSGKSNHARTEVSLINDVDEATRAALIFKKGIGSNAYSQNVFDSYEISARWSRLLTSRIDTKIDAFYGEGEYQTTNIEEKFTGAGFALNYALTQHAKVGFAYSFSENHSSVTSRSYIRNYVQLATQVLF